MAKKIAVMLDGGHVRVYAKKAGYTYDPSYIEKIAHACVMADEELYRILYYDCAPFVGTALLPVSGQKKTFAGSDSWLHELARKDRETRNSEVSRIRFKAYPFSANQPLTGFGLSAVL